MLDHADDAALAQSLDRRAAERGHAHRLRPEGAVADDVVAGRVAHVEQGQAIDVHADLGQHHRDRLRVGARRLDRGHRRNVVKPVERLGLGEGGPFGRRHAGDAAAFLIDQDRQIGAAGERPQVVGQRAHLRAIDAVAAEQDIAGGRDLREEGALVRGQHGAGEAEEQGCHASGLRVGSRRL